jgi:cytidylate kinase
MNSIVITIDGYCSCGKSTLAKDLAKAMSYKYVDTGAMYRAVTLYFIRHGIDRENGQAVKQALNDISIDFSYAPETGEQITNLNGYPVEEAIRAFEVSARVSQVSAIRDVRAKMVEQQQRFGEEKGIVMDGRDIGTVVFPEAELKFFLTASQPVRTKRRYDELRGAGKIVTVEEVRKNLEERDYMDTTRQESPLRRAADALILDNTHLSTADQLAYTKARALETLHAQTHP